MSNQNKKTPVGSRNRKGIRAQMEVPVNLERVLIEAGKDLAFYQMLVSDPARALVDRGYRLRATEQAMLSAMPQTALRKMIDQLRPEKLAKSRFAKQVATAVAGTMLFTTAACESATAGVDPEYLPDTSTSGTAGTGGVGGSDSVDASDANRDSGQQAGSGGEPVWQNDTGTPVLDAGSRDGGQAGSGGEPVWQADTGTEVDAGISPDIPDTSVDSDQAEDADLPTWETDSGNVSRGIAPDFPNSGANDPGNNNNQGGN